MSVLIPKDIDVLSIDLTEHDKRIRAEVVEEYTNKLEDLIRHGIFVSRNELFENILSIATEIKEQKQW